MRQKFLNFITLKGFSKATIRTYLSLFDIKVSDFVRKAISEKIKRD